MKSGPIENANWARLSGNSSYFRGPAPLRFGSWSVCCRHLLVRVCVAWYIELFGGGWKSAPIENVKWYAIVWKFQLFPGSRPVRFGSWSVWCRHLLGRVFVSWYIELFGGGGGKAARSRTETGTRLSGNSTSPRGPAPLCLVLGPFGVGIY